MEPTEKSPTTDEQVLALLRHDVRSPLLNLSMVANLLGRDPSTADLGELVAEAAQRIGRLTRDLGDFALVRTGHPLALDRHPIDPKALAERAVAELTLPNHPIEVTGDAATVLVDPDRVTQLIQNLVSGAIKYGKQRTPVRLHARAAEDALVLTADVDGPPVAAERLAAAFTADSVGLCLVRLIAEAHGGAASVCSSDTGTAFAVRLPTA